MAWIDDPNFGSSHFAIDAVAPWPTGDNNKILRYGAGVVYENSLSASNASITWQQVNRDSVSGDNVSVGVACVKVSAVALNLLIAPDIWPEFSMPTDI